MTGEYTSHADLGGRRIEGVIGSEPEGKLWHANWEPRVMAGRSLDRSELPTPSACATAPVRWQGWRRIR